MFAAILGVSQLAALGVFPLFSKRFTRKQLISAQRCCVLARIYFVLLFTHEYDPGRHRGVLLLLAKRSYSC